MTTPPNRLILSGLLLPVLLMSRPLLAGSVHVNFEGTVTSTLTINEISSGARVHGWFEFNPNVGDSSPTDPALGLYPAVTAAEIEVGGHSYRAGDGTLSVMNDAVIDPGNPAPIDAFGLNAGPPLDGDSLSGLPPFQIEINLGDTTASAFSDDSLPSAPDASHFDIRSHGPSGTTGGRLHFKSVAKPTPGVVQFRIDRMQVGH